VKKIWVNSADSHYLEPEDLWSSSLPKRLADLVPRSEKDPDGEWETVHVDGQSFRRKLPTGASNRHGDGMKPQGARDPKARLVDLDNEGVWAEVMFASLGMWNSSVRTPELLREVMRVSNDWVHETFMNVSPRFVATAQVSVLDVDDAVAEMHRCVDLGFPAISLPTTPNPVQKDYHHDIWEPLWAAAEEAAVVVTFHIGSDPVDLSEKAHAGLVYRGPGGAVLNYAETTFSGQRVAMKMVASGALDRHPRLKVLIAEGGASWVPFLGDRMREGYRQHHAAVRPKLSRDPKEILYDQVYASFQHDETAVQTYTGMGYDKVCFGSDYPHMEGTFGHTQETLRSLFDGVSDDVRYRITQGAFLELFPNVPPIPSHTTHNV
jgi:predicted TIM-barrel fold metal-dependent hydrolase